MIRYPRRYHELMVKVRKYYVPVWNEDHTDILRFQVDPDAPEEIKKAYEEAQYVYGHRAKFLEMEDRKERFKNKREHRKRKKEKNKYSGFSEYQ